MSDSSRTFRWGIIGPGSIAHKFATALPHASNTKLAAVASRTKSRAEDFASEFGAERAYGSYEELAADPEVDAIYVATPHTEHASGAKLCIAHGKPVLVEKPFAVNTAQAREVVEMARQKNVFCMEGMWTWCFPAIRLLRDLVSQGAIGKVRMIQSDFGFRAGINPEARLFNPALAGGGLLDVGIYPISLAVMLLGKPTEISGVADIGETGVDEAAAMLLRFEGGALAVLSSAIRVDTPKEALIIGEEGSIRVLPDGQWWKSESLAVRRGHDAEERISMPYPSTGFQFEADEVRRCVAAGKTESEIIPLDNTLMRMDILDELRRQWGLKYPGE